MFTVPSPTLGQVSAIAIHSADLNQSLSCYRQLGYTEVLRGASWLLISDTALYILLIQNPRPLSALLYYTKDVDAVAAEMQQRGMVFHSVTSAGNTKLYTLLSTDGLQITLLENTAGIQPPAGKTMLTLPQQDYFKQELYPNKVCGLFGEYCHPVKQLGVSIAFWEKLGFTTLSKFESPYPWAIISDGLSVVGLHQTDHFAYPAITYFGVGMAGRIEALKKAGFTSPIDTGASNMVLKTPEGQHINLFSF